jgi:hypothetical protein
MKDNKLIAEFMGWDIESPTTIPSNLHLSNLELDSGEVWAYKFHTSWDWLIPVILKLSPLTECGIKIQRNETIESAYSFVVKFIKEHNEVDRLVYLSKYTCDSCGDRTDRVAFNEDKDINECMDCI